jgi:hypothetical protein
MNRIGRIFAADGYIDKSFNPGTGADSFVNSIALSLFSEEGDNPQEQLVVTKYVIGGGFSSYNGQPRNGIARIEADGSLDTDFDPGKGIEDGTVFSVHVQQGNQVLVVGEFTSVDGFQRNGIVRFLENGEVDESFDIGEGPDGPIYTLTQMPDGRIVIGGSFSAIGDSPSSSLAVLQSNGQLDPNFHIGKGVLGEVYALDVVTQGASARIVIGGSFSEVKGYKMNNLGILKTDGSLDEFFDIGEGADGPVYSVKIDDSQNIVATSTFHLAGQDDLMKTIFDSNPPDLGIDEDAEFLNYLAQYEEYAGYIPAYLQNYARSKFPPMYRIVIAGDFRSYNETRRMGLTRLNPDGSVDTSFLDTAFNQFAGVTAGTSRQPTGLINAIAIGADPTDPSVYIAGNFQRVGGGQSRSSTLPVSNVAKLASGTTSGPGELEFEEEEYRVDEDKQTGQIAIRRKNGRRGFASAIIQTENLPQGAGAASGSDIVPIEEADFVALKEFVLFEHYSSTVAGKPMYNLSVYVDEAAPFVDAAYYTDLSDTYRALLPHAFEPP